MDQTAVQIENLRPFRPSLGLVAQPESRGEYVASTFRRAQAFLFDEFMRALAFVPWWIAIGFRWPTPENIVASSGWLALCFGFHFLARVMCLRFVGATPGKLIMGLRLVGRDRDELSWSQCALRTLTDDLSMAFGMGPRMLAFLRFDRTHLSDWIAETKVIQLKPRTRFPHRRFIIALFLCALFSVEGLQNTVYWLQKVAATSGR